MKNQILLFAFCLGFLSLFSCKTEASKDATANTNPSKEEVMNIAEDSLIETITLELNEKANELDSALDELEAEFPEE